MRFNEGRSAKSGPGSQIGAVGHAVKGRERLTTPSIYAQRLFMGPKYNTATSISLPSITFEEDSTHLGQIS